MKARKVPLKTLGDKAPKFDYCDAITMTVGTPTDSRGGSGNSSSDLRVMHRIFRAMDDAKGRGEDFLILDDTDYNFLSARVSGFSNWAALDAATTRHAIQFIDDVAAAQEVEVGEKSLPDGTPRRAKH